MKSTTLIHATAEVSSNAIIGAGTRIWNQVQVREGARIGRGCVLGKDVYIDRDVVIGDHVKIQNGVSVYKGVTLEDEVFVGPYATFTNDLRPRAASKDWTVIPTLLRRGASVGANATVLCGITLGEYCMIAAGSVVTSDTLPYGDYVGNPARLKGFVSMSGFQMDLVEPGAKRLTFMCGKTRERLSLTFEVLD